MFGRNKIATLVAEFLGTGVLTLVILSVQRSTIGIPYFVALAAGLATATLVVALGRATSAHLNPAVTLALWTARQVRTLEALALIAMQFLGAWVAYYLYTFFVNSSLQPIGGHYTSRVLAAEAVGGLVLGLGWAAAVYHNYLNSYKAVAVGAAYALAIIVASSASIGLINPAVALGVRAWVWGTYVAGPILGAIVGVNLYAWLFAPRTALAVSSASSKPVVVEKVKPARVEKKSADTKSAKVSTKKPARTTKKR
jgi:glycerol uptake facilitator-like aquaporin